MFGSEENINDTARASSVVCTSIEGNLLCFNLDVNIKFF